jgi:hypothetical protein
LKGNRCVTQSRLRANRRGAGAVGQQGVAGWSGHPHRQKDGSMTQYLKPANMLIALGVAFIGQIAMFALVLN